MENQSSTSNTIAETLSKAGASPEVMLCLLPPPNQWQQYVALKDPFFKPSLRAKGREPFPHITLVQTRLANAKDALDTLAMAVTETEHEIQAEKVEPFLLNFQTIQSFKFKKGSVIYITDVSPEVQRHFVCLHDVATSALPASNGNNDENFTAHIGLGSVPAKQYPQIQEKYSDAVAKWPESSFQCEHMYLLVRGQQGPWTVAAAIPLFGCVDMPPSVAIGSETRVHPGLTSRVVT